MKVAFYFLFRNRISLFPPLIIIKTNFHLIIRFPLQKKQLRYCMNFSVIFLYKLYESLFFTSFLNLVYCFPSLHFLHHLALAAHTKNLSYSPRFCKEFLSLSFFKVPVNHTLILIFNKKTSSGLSRDKLVRLSIFRNRYSKD